MTGQGALSGAFWGMLFGLLFFVPFFGLAVGAAMGCLLYTSDAADERSSVDLGGRRIIKKKTNYTLRAGIVMIHTRTYNNKTRSQTH